MVAVSRKKATVVIRTKASKPKEPINWWRIIKASTVALCFGLGLLLYANWEILLEKLDRTPIKSYVLTHKTAFTTNSDVREILSKHPAVHGYLGNNRQKVEIWRWLPWSYTTLQGVLSLQPSLKGYFSQDIEDLKIRFLEIPWIKDVIVRKIYPDKLSISLLEHQPVARWNNQQYLSEQGVVFSLPDGRFKADHLPILFGPDNEGKTVLEAWNKIKQDLKLRNLTLYSVKMDNRGAWTITLDSGVALRLGRGDWLPKIDRFVAIYPQIEIPEEMRLAYVDLRYDHGAAVGFMKK